MIKLSRCLKHNLMDQKHESMDFLKKNSASVWARHQAGLLERNVTACCIVNEGCQDVGEPNALAVTWVSKGIGYTKSLLQADCVGLFSKISSVVIGIGKQHIFISLGYSKPQASPNLTARVAFLMETSALHVLCAPWSLGHAGSMSSSHTRVSPAWHRASGELALGQRWLGPVLHTGGLQGPTHLTSPLSHRLTLSSHLLSLCPAWLPQHGLAPLGQGQTRRHCGSSSVIY